MVKNILPGDDSFFRSSPKLTSNRKSKLHKLRRWFLMNKPSSQPLHTWRSTFVKQPKLSFSLPFFCCVSFEQYLALKFRWVGLVNKKEGKHRRNELNSSDFRGSVMKRWNTRREKIQWYFASLSIIDVNVNECRVSRAIQVVYMTTFRLAQWLAMTFLLMRLTTITSHACPAELSFKKWSTCAKGIQEFNSVRGRRALYYCWAHFVYGDGVISQHWTCKLTQF